MAHVREMRIPAGAQDPYYSALSLSPNIHLSLQLFEATRPNLLITGHSHKAFAMRCLRCWDPNGGVLEHVQHPGAHFSQLQFALSTADVDGVLEIGVPTCSYRMGSPHMAYGLLTVNSDGAAQYINLWLPSRFACLYLYLVAVCLALFSFVVHRRRRGRRLS